MVNTSDLRLAVESTETLQADASRLQQAFENLFANAAEHATVGQRVATTVRIGRLPTVSGFYIEDDGPGIPEGRREDLLAFGVSTGSGSGYGLAIVRTIVEAHGWSLSVTESTEGGARFEIETTPRAR